MKSLREFLGTVAVCLMFAVVAILLSVVGGQN